jgi:hypothetical protein
VGEKNRLISPRLPIALSPLLSFFPVVIMDETGYTLTIGSKEATVCWKATFIRPSILS